MNPRTALAAAVALLMILTVGAAVGLATGGARAVPGVALAAPGGEPGEPASAPPAPSPAERAPDLPAPDPAPTATPTAAQLRAAMLRPADVGGAWRAEVVPPVTEARSVCGGSGVIDRFPDAQRAGAALSSGDQRVQETVSVFGDDATATRAFAAYGSGLACARGTVGGTKVAVSAGDDVTGRVAADGATAWTLTAANTTIVIVSARSGRQLMNLAVLTPAGRKGADAAALARTAVARLRAT